MWFPQSIDGTNMLPISRGWARKLVMYLMLETRPLVRNTNNTNNDEDQQVDADKSKQDDQMKPSINNLTKINIKNIM